MFAPDYVYFIFPILPTPWAFIRCPLFPSYHILFHEQNVLTFVWMPTDGKPAVHFALLAQVKTNLWFAAVQNSFVSAFPSIVRFLDHWDNCTGPYWIGSQYVCCQRNIPMHGLGVCIKRVPDAVWLLLLLLTNPFPHLAMRLWWGLWGGPCLGVCEWIRG